MFAIYLSIKLSGYDLRMLFPITVVLDKNYLQTLELFLDFKIMTCGV